MDNTISKMFVNAIGGNSQGYRAVIQLDNEKIAFTSEYSKNVLKEFIETEIPKNNKVLKIITEEEYQKMLKTGGKK